MTTVNKARLWTLAETMLGAEDWKHKIGTLAGCASAHPLRVRTVLESDSRDLLIFASRRVVVIEVTPTNKLKLRAAFKAARGNYTGMGNLRQWPREQVVSFSLSPGGIQTATLVVKAPQGEETIEFFVDDNLIPPDAIEKNVARWLEDA